MPPVSESAADPEEFWRYLDELVAGLRLVIDRPKGSLREGAAVEAFLNIDPTTTLEARVRLASYTAAPSPQDVLSYPLRATFETGAPRIGLKATAKVYGERVPFVYSLLRRPLSALRRQLGQIQGLLARVGERQATVSKFCAGVNQRVLEVNLREVERLYDVSLVNPVK